MLIIIIVRGDGITFLSYCFFVHELYTTFSRARVLIERELNSIITKTCFFRARSRFYATTVGGHAGFLKSTAAGERDGGFFFVLYLHIRRSNDGQKKKKKEKKTHREVCFFSTRSRGERKSTKPSNFYLLSLSLFRFRFICFGCFGARVRFEPQGQARTALCAMWRRRRPRVLAQD